MKKLFYFISLAVLLLAASSCTKTEPQPVYDYKVDRLVSPRNNLGVNVYNITSVLRFEWEAKDIEEGETFNLVFDRLGGDFKNPLYSVRSGENFYEFTKDEAKELYEALEPEDGVSVASWTVVAKSSQGEKMCEQTRNIILSKEADPAVVEFLYSPADNNTVNLARIKKDVEFKWAEASYNGDGQVTYDLVFFTNSVKEPVATYPATGESLMVTKEQLSQILATLDPSNDPKNAQVKWTVNPKADGHVWVSTVFFTLNLTNDASKAFTAGTPMYLGCSGDEAGRQLAYIGENHYKSGEIYQDKLKSCGEGDWGYYEIFAELKAGQNYFFYTLADETTVDCFIKGDELKVVDTEQEAYATVAADALYRIRVNTVNKQVGFAKVSKVVIRRTWDAHDAELEYAGNGIWTAKDYNVDWAINGSTKDERYRFIMSISNVDGSNAQEQGWSQQTRADGRPTKETAASYYFMKPTNLSQWDNVWKYPAWLLDANNPRLWSCDVNFITSGENAFYTHEFVNEYVWGRTDDFREGYDLKIGGTGADAGQAFAFLSNNKWYNTASGWNDMVGRIDGDYYEIYTELKAGGQYYFYGDSNPDKMWFFNPNTLQQATSATAASVTVSEGGLYRIRIQYAEGKVDMAKIGSVYLNNGWGELGKSNAVLTYRGFGVWKAAQLKLSLHDFKDPSRQDPFDTRYKICMEIEDKTQGLGKVADGSMFVQLTGGGNWDERLFNFPAAVVDSKHNDRFNADVVLYMNTSKTQYTHAFENVTDNYPGAFNPGDDLFIYGAGAAEAGQQLSYISENEWNLSINPSGQVSAFASQVYNYEIFTKLSAGQTVYFRNEKSTAFFSLNADGSALVELDAASDAAFKVTKDGIYRVRFDTSSKKAYFAEVTKAGLWSCGENKLFEMKYKAKGTWEINNHKPVITQGWNDERYMFRLTIGGVEQPYARMHTEGNRPNASTPVSYYYCQPTPVNQWDPGFKWNNTIFDAAMANGKTYPGGLTVYLHMNEDNGHYTHEVVIE